MNVFVFQSIPERYDLREKIVPGVADTWYATRYRSQMQTGDVVLFWMAGDKHFRGLYGWGELTSSPYLKTDWASHGVDVKYAEKFSRAIRASSIQEDSVLAEMLIFRAPQATNFLLSPQHAKRLVKLIKDRGESAPVLLGEEQ